MELLQQGELLEANVAALHLEDAQAADDVVLLRLHGGSEGGELGEGARGVVGEAHCDVLRGQDRIGLSPVGTELIHGGDVRAISSYRHRA